VGWCVGVFFGHLWPLQWTPGAVTGRCRRLSQLNPAGCAHGRPRPRVQVPLGSLQLQQIRRAVRAASRARRW
jgi:hypothetical protein